MPLGVDGLYTYAMPPEWGSGQGAPTDLVGCRVRVPFGKRKQYVGLVMEIHQNQPAYPIKEALERLDSRPIWGRHGQDLWEWMLRYYLCSPGALMGLALPALLRVGSESVLVTMDLVEEEGLDVWQDLHPLSKQLWERLRQGPGMNLEAVQRWMVPHNPTPWIQELMEAGLIGTLENFSKIYQENQGIDFTFISQISEDYGVVFYMQDYGNYIQIQLQDKKGVEGNYFEYNFLLGK